MGKLRYIHYFDWAIFNSYVNVYQRVSEHLLVGGFNHLEKY